MQGYDEFKAGDKVWAEAFGFGKITLRNHGIYGESLSVAFKKQTPMFEMNVIEIFEDGTLFGHSDRPRTFFHAVYDTDEGMRDGIKRGEGLRRNGKTIDWDSLIKGCSIRDFENLLAAVEKAKARFIEYSTGGGCE